MGSLEAFIHHENLILFKKQLADPRISDAQRQQLLRLLMKEEAKDFHDDKGRSDGPPTGGSNLRRAGLGEKNEFLKFPSAADSNALIVSRT